MSDSKLTHHNCPFWFMAAGDVRWPWCKSWSKDYRHLFRIIPPKLPKLDVCGLKSGNKVKQAIKEDTKQLGNKLVPVNGGGSTRLFLSQTTKNDQIYIHTDIESIEDPQFLRILIKSSSFYKLIAKRKTPHSKRLSRKPKEEYIQKSPMPSFTLQIWWRKKSRIWLLNSTNIGKVSCAVGVGHF